MYADDSTILLAEKNVRATFSCHTLHSTWCFVFVLYSMSGRFVTKQITFGRSKGEIPTIPDAAYEDHNALLGIIIDGGVS